MESSEELRVDLRTVSREDREHMQEVTRKMYRLNHTEPFTEAYDKALRDLFGDNLGEDSCVAAPLQGACVDMMRIGKGVYINSNCLAMARGGITIEDGVQIAANVQLLSNNHDPYDLPVLTCRPVVIRAHAWIGAGATILPGVTVGRHAIIGAAAVVTKDVPDYAVAVGNPAKVIRMLDPEKFVTD